MTERKPFPFAAILFVVAGGFFLLSDVFWGVWLIAEMGDVSSFLYAFDPKLPYLWIEFACFVLGIILFFRQKNILTVIPLAILSVLSAWNAYECIYWVLDTTEWWSPGWRDYADCFVSLIALLVWVVLTVYAVLLMAGVKDVLKLWYLPGCIYALPMLYDTATGIWDVVEEFVYLLQCIPHYDVETITEIGNQCSVYASVCCYEIYGVQAVNAGIFLLGLWFYKMAKRDAE